MIHAGVIDNLSARAYLLAPPPEGVTLVHDSPANLCRLTQAGDCDVALLPVGCLNRFPEALAPLGEFGIACAGAVHSVVLKSAHPLDQLFGRRLPIHVTGQSESSRVLLNILGLMRYGVLPVIETDKARSQAQLYIGDEALTEQSIADGAGYTDLCAWWREETGLPFVFARWMARPEMAQGDRNRLIDWLRVCAELAETSEGRRRMAAMGAVPVNKAWLRTVYYGAVHSKLDDQDLRGLARFHELQAREPLCRKTA